MNPSDFRLERQRLGLSQQALAEMAGVSQATISQLERGRSVASPFLVRQLEAILGESIRQAPVTWDTEADYWWITKLAELSTPNLTVRTWQNPPPDHSGDLLVVKSQRSDSIAAAFIVAVDIAGSGERLSKIAIHLRGWISGYLQQFNAIAMPSPRTILHDLSDEVSRLEVEASAFVATIRHQYDNHVAEIETINAAFPPPIIFLGPPFETKATSIPGPALPWVKEESTPKSMLVVRAPMRMVIATDGLLQRLGEGYEDGGKQRIRKWQTSALRRQSPEKNLGVAAPVGDDELCSVVCWEAWNMQETIVSSDDAMRHQVIYKIKRAVPELPEEKASCLIQAIVEALDNAKSHSIGGKGLVVVRLHDEPKLYRVEVEDDGTRRPTTKEIARPQSGFAIIQHMIDQMYVEESEGGGTIVGLIQRKT
ncbi:MAG: helix-turn-helix domain-containing protein [Planctomycetes bacterium]|nr:helix-turn-helix domain-containing protein [Planctomycetota bacterium]